MAFYQYKSEQILPASMEEVWQFISSPANLKKITPAYMGFDIISEAPDKMYPGLIVTYTVSPLFGIKTAWMTEITHMVEGKFFVDEQRIGPYALWHHQHLIEPIENGVLMKDIVTYAPPLWWIGKLANRLIIKRKLNEIFEFRRKALIKVFGEVKLDVAV
ncbi:MAG: SRPBCC family protein [Reichenbachiella sp.]|uniref:SRPBCC family protein n=1 Tax=Reichenbachiella sp. TaxID=2184521 RepID=UPI003297CBAA